MEQAADLIADVAPDQGSAVAGTVTHDAVATAAGGAEVSVPVDPAEPLTLTAVGDQTSAPIEVSLPEDPVVISAGFDQLNGWVFATAAALGVVGAVTDYRRRKRSAAH